jgi:hypothetical protein
VVVNLFLPDGVHVNTYYKFISGQWVEFLYDPATDTGAKFFDDDHDGDTDRVELHLVDGGRGDTDPSDGSIGDPGGPGFRSPRPAHIASILVNNGAKQRSRVTSLTVLFDSVVTLSKGAFTIRQLDGGDPIGVRVALSTVNGQTKAVLTFTGADIIHHSLPDGRYQLIIHAHRIHDRFGRALDGNNDGQPGGDRTFAFFRRFGDLNGNGIVNMTDPADRALFRASLGSHKGEPNYRWGLDYDGDGRLGWFDWLAFETAYWTGTSVGSAAHGPTWPTFLSWVRWDFLASNSHWLTLTPPTGSKPEQKARDNQ